MSATTSLEAAVPRLKIRKRSGRVVDYDRQKILQAVLLCLVNGCLKDNNQATRDLAARVTDKVQAIIAQSDGSSSVEQIQNLVETVLMAMGEHEAARQYIIYREEHRKLREELAPVDAATRAAFDEGMACFTGVNKNLQIVQALDKFARYRDDLGGRREVWPETVNRVMGFFHEEINNRRGMGVPAEKWDWLKQGLMKHQAAPSMRAIQLAGPALHRCNVGTFNCSALLMDSPEAMAEDLYLLTCGSGVGFSVESSAVDAWPRVKRQTGKSPRTIVVPDSSEGWCDTLKDSVYTWLNGDDVTHDVSLVRSEGVPLKTKGGTASGAGPLLDLLRFARHRILSKQSGCLSSLDIHDITCYIHRIVQMGGVRRASGISLSDIGDVLMRDCKAGNFYASNPQRNQANNSCVYTVKPTAEQFLDEWSALVKGKSGERGIFNRAGAIAHMPARRRDNLTDGEKQTIICNPCAEILLLNKGLCNLSIGVIRPEDDVRTIESKIEMAAAWGTMQSCLTRFNYLRDDWRKNAEKERLLGVDLLGFLDNKHIGPRSSGDRAGLLRHLRDHAVATNVTWAKQLGINSSAAVTCIKPSGDSSVFFDTAAGFKPHHGQYFIRRLRMKPSNPVARLLKDHGVPCIVDHDASGLLVFEFPCRPPVDDPILLADRDAITQLEEWKLWRENWVEHSPSCTIYVRDSEWVAVGSWVWENWDYVTGLSFFPYDDSVYRLAPYETIDEAEYTQRQAAMPTIDWAKLSRYEIRDMTELKQHLACSGDRCEI